MATAKQKLAQSRHAKKVKSVKSRNRDGDSLSHLDGGREEKVSAREKSTKTANKKEEKSRREVKKAEAIETEKTQAALKEKYHAGTRSLKAEKLEPEIKHFNWNPLKLKNIWDGSPGIWQSRDPKTVFSDYPDEYVTDPVTRRIPMQRVKSRDRDCLEHELMYKINRKKFLKELTEKQLAVLETRNGGPLPDVEYFAVMAREKFIVATSFGADGASPIDQLK